MTNAKTGKKNFLHTAIKHIDIKRHDTRALVEDMSHMSSSARDLGRASHIYDFMVRDKDATVFLAIAGSASAAGCMQVYVDMVKSNMVDVIVATGASIVDMDFFEALGFKHYVGTPNVDDSELRSHRIGRIYDTLIDEDELQHCDLTVREIADGLEPRA